MGIRRYIILIFLFFSICLLGKEEIKFQWEEIETNTNQQLIFVAGNSTNNFWVQDLTGKLLHIKKGIAKILHPPSNISYIGAYYYKISDNNFFCVIITPQWESEIYSITNNKWIKYNLTLNAPVKHFTKTEDGKIYLSGDFGLLLRFGNNKWEIIKTPFNSHIISIFTNKNNLYLATRNDGTILFDGENFTFLSKRYKNINSVQIISDTLFALSLNNKIIKYVNSTEIVIKNNEVLKYFTIFDSPKFGFIERNVLHKNKLCKINFPQKYNVFSPPIGFKNIHTFDNGSIILFSNDGKMFTSKQVTKKKFIDLAQTYRVNDLPNSQTKGTQFFDANNDGVMDLLLLNNNYGNYLSFYRGVENSAFADITSISNLPATKSEISFFTITDFNKDELKDIILEMYEDSLHKLILYQNNGNFKFENINEIILPSDFQTMGIRDLSSYDYDKDGDDDIIVTAYYGAEGKHGYLLIYKNNYWGNFSQVDTTLKSITQNWNEKFIFADITNNDTLDIFNSTLWTNDNLFIKGKNGFSKKIIPFPHQKNTETTDALLSDFDNDGDLDIFTVGKNDFIHVYSNNKNGNFIDCTNNLFDKQFLEKHNFKNSSGFKIADFNNDSYVDIFVSLSLSDTIYTTLFISDKGNKFIETPINFDNNNFISTSNTISDYDNDGDLDIYCGTKKYNYLWINTLDKNNFVKIKLNGIISSPQALGSKVWVYENGKLDSSKFLIGYKELGTEIISRNLADDFTLHFGLGERKGCDVKVQFPSGKSILLPNIIAGSSLTVNELPFLLSAFYQFPGNIFRFLAKPQNQIYILLIIISHLILILGMWNGALKIKWSLKLTLFFTVLNISLFWISLYFSSLSNNSYIKFLIPLAVTIFVTIIPLLLFYWFNKTTEKNDYIYNDKLLELIMAFSHGEWALRNLNSIILLCENAPKNWKDNANFTAKLKTRLNTFVNMTISSIDEIINYEKLIGNNTDEIKSFETISAETIESIKEITAKRAQPNLNQLTENLKSIRANIKELKNDIYSRFTSNPTEVINDLIANFENTLNENLISVKKQKLYSNEIPVLIKNYELGDIIDNIFQNSIRFMKKSKRKTILIELKKESPKIVLTITNTGTPIHKDKWDIIFEQAYSESKSTGQGLFSARQVLKKYGGKIYVSESNYSKTSFTIELNEGIIK